MDEPELSDITQVDSLISNEIAKSNQATPSKTRRKRKKKIKSAAAKLQDGWIVIPPHLQMILLRVFWNWNIVLNCSFRIWNLFSTQKMETQQANALKSLICNLDRFEKINSFPALVYYLNSVMKYMTSQRWQEDVSSHQADFDKNVNADTGLYYSRLCTSLANAIPRFKKESEEIANSSISHKPLNKSTNKSKAPDFNKPLDLLQQIQDQLCKPCEKKHLEMVDNLPQPVHASQTIQVVEPEQNEKNDAIRSINPCSGLCVVHLSHTYTEVHQIWQAAILCRPLILPESSSKLLTV